MIPPAFAIRQGNSAERAVIRVYYLSISAADLLSAVDRMAFDKRDAEIFVKM
jgi:hypothetical protein